MPDVLKQSTMQIAAWDIIKIVTLTSDGLASHLKQFISKGVDFFKSSYTTYICCKKKNIPNSLFGRNRVG